MTTAVEVAEKGHQLAAWVNFNGTGTVAIRAAYNVASITDNGTGNYTINFTTAMPDANFAANWSMECSSNSSGWLCQISNYTTTSVSLITKAYSTGYFDSPTNSVAIFR
jgi:predicted DNA binding protein